MITVIQITCQGVPRCITVSHIVSIEPKEKYLGCFIRTLGGISFSVDQTYEKILEMLGLIDS